MVLKVGFGGRELKLRLEDFVCRLSTAFFCFFSAESKHLNQTFLFFSVIHWHGLIAFSTDCIPTFFDHGVLSFFCFVSLFEADRMLALRETQE